MIIDSESASAPIGVFDSGVGGLTVVREIMRQLPDEKIIYFGDTARVPYGSKSKDTVTKYSRQIIRFLRTKNVKAIVIACNTASAYALEDIRKEINIPIIGVVKPGAKVAAQTTHNKKIGIIATEATISSNIYTEFIKEISPESSVISKACPLFVPLVEEGLTQDWVTKEIAARYLQELKKCNIDTLILGCTHYPLIRKLIGEVMGQDVTLVNPAYETAKELEKLLQDERLEARHCQNDKNKMYELYVSDTAEKFKTFALSILPFEVETIKQINIEEY